MKLRISLFVVAELLLGAHFLRAGNVPLMALCVATPLLFLYRNRWSLVLLQLSAYGGAANWVVVAVQLVQVRQQYGQPWTAAAIILASVALFTLLAGLMLNSRSIRERYR